eukprot:2268821-Alexandrium_andersonii.AAC.1
MTTAGGGTAGSHRRTGRGLVPGIEPKDHLNMGPEACLGQRNTGGHRGIALASARGTRRQGARGPTTETMAMLDA